MFVNFKLVSLMKCSNQTKQKNIFTFSTAVQIGERLIDY